jgi:hypothetical protein
VQLPTTGQRRPIQQLKKFSEAKRTTRCHQCEHIAEAVCWEGAAVESAV